MRKQLERFLFDQANPRSAAILRIWLAAVTAAVFYPADGMAVNPAIRSPWTAPLYKDLFLTQAYWGLAFIALAAFAGGWRTRIAGLAAALLLAPCVPVQDRLPGRFMMWFALAAFSLLRSDRCWTLRAGEAAHPVGPVWPVRLIQFQLTALYFVNAVAKTTTGYLSGGALAAMSQQLPNFRMDLTQGVFPLAGVAFPLWLAAAASAAVEYALAIGFWIPRLRWAAAALGVAFHLALMWVVAIGRLDIAAMSLYVFFLLPWSTKAKRKVAGRQGFEPR